MRVELGDDMWMELQEDPTMATIERLNKGAQVFDKDAGAWRTDEIKGAIVAVPLLVEEWNVTDRAGNVMPITAEGMRRLPMSVGLRVTRAIGKYVASFNPDGEDADTGKATEP